MHIVDENKMKPWKRIGQTIDIIHQFSELNIMGSEAEKQVEVVKEVEAAVPPSPDAQRPRRRTTAVTVSGGCGCGCGVRNKVATIQKFQDDEPWRQEMNDLKKTMANRVQSMKVVNKKGGTPDDDGDDDEDGNGGSDESGGGSGDEEDTDDMSNRSRTKGRSPNIQKLNRGSSIAGSSPNPVPLTERISPTFKHGLPCLRVR